MLLAVAGRDTSTAFISRLGSSYGAYRPFGTSLKFQEACGLKALSYMGEDPRKAYRASDSGTPRHHVSRLRWPMKRLAPYDRSRRPSFGLRLSSRHLRVWARLSLCTQPACTCTAQCRSHELWEGSPANFLARLCHAGRILAFCETPLPLS